MANNLSAQNPKYWSKRLQYLLYKNLVSRDIANFEEAALLVNWDTVQRNIPWDVYPDDYVAGTDTVPQNMVVTQETLTINISKNITVYYDMNEEIQNSLNVVNEVYIDRAWYKLRDEIDGRFLKEIENAVYTFDAGNIGWTAWQPIVLTSWNVIETFSEAWSTLRAGNVETDRPWISVVPPSVVSKMRQSNVLTGFDLADQTLREWFLNKEVQGIYEGWVVMSSNNVTASNVLTYSGQPSNGETLVIGWVTYTFVSSIGSTEWNILIGADADATYTNLYNSISGGTGSGTTYIPLTNSSDSGKAFKNILLTAVLDTTGNTVTFYTAGKVTYTDGVSNATLWTQVFHCYLARKGATDMVIQKEVTVQKNKAPLKNGYYYLLWDLYGIKTFDEGTKRMLKLVIKA